MENGLSLCAARETSKVLLLGKSRFVCEGIIIIAHMKRNALHSFSLAA